MRDGWTSTTLGEIATIVGGGTPSTKNPAYWGGDILWVTPTEITRQEGQVVTRTDRTITQLGLANSSATLVPAGTVLLTSRATIGAVAIAGREMATNQGFAALIPDRSKVVPEFLMYWCQGHRRDFERRAGGNTFKEVSRREVATVPISLPPLGEQRRIVDLISSIDQAIEAAKPLISLVDAVWASLIAKETSEVEQIGLREVVATAKAGGTPSRDRPDFYNGDIPWLKSGEVANGEISEAEEAITEKGLANSSAWLVPAGAVLVAMYGATAGAVGYLQRPMATNQAVLALIGEPSQVDQRFLYHWLRSRAEHMKARATGAAQPNLSKARVLEEPFPLLDVESQRGLSITLDSILDIADQAKKFVSVATSLRNQLGAALLSGEHTIPDSYDHLLEDAS